MADKYLYFEAPDLGYYDPRTGEDLTLECLHIKFNRPKIDPVEHRGIDYPDAVNKKDKTLNWHEITYTDKRILILKMDLTNTEVEEIKIKDSKYKAKEITKKEAEDLGMVEPEPEIED